MRPKNEVEKEAFDKIENSLDKIKMGIGSESNLVHEWDKIAENIAANPSAGMYWAGRLDYESSVTTIREQLAFIKDTTSKQEFVRKINRLMTHLTEVFLNISHQHNQDSAGVKASKARLTGLYLALGNIIGYDAEKLKQTLDRIADTAEQAKAKSSFAVSPPSSSVTTAASEKSGVVIPSLTSADKPSSEYSKMVEEYEKFHKSLTVLISEKHYLLGETKVMSLTAADFSEYVKSLQQKKEEAKALQESLISKNSDNISDKNKYDAMIGNLAKTQETCGNFINLIESLQKIFTDYKEIGRKYNAALLSKNITDLETVRKDYEVASKAFDDFLTTNKSVIEGLQNSLYQGGAIYTLEKQIKEITETYKVEAKVQIDFINKKIDSLTKPAPQVTAASSSVSSQKAAQNSVAPVAKTIPSLAAPNPKIAIQKPPEPQSTAKAGASIMTAGTNLLNRFMGPKSTKSPEPVKAPSTKTPEKPKLLNGIEGAAFKEKGYINPEAYSDSKNVSNVVSASMYESNNKSSKPSDDLALTGVSIEGLPFMLVVDGAFRCPKEKVFAFINQEMLVRLPIYLAKIKNAHDASEHKKISEEFIKEILTTCKKEWAMQGVDFSFALAMTYEKEGKLAVCGCGVGDVGLIARDNKGNIKQLIYNQEQREKSDSAGNMAGGLEKPYKDLINESTNDNRIKEICGRSQSFNHSINVDDLLLGYTSVPKSMENELPNTTLTTVTRQRRNYDTKGMENFTVEIESKFTGLKLDPRLTDKSVTNDSFLKKMWGTCVQEHEQALTTAQITYERELAAAPTERDRISVGYQFGDDATMCTIKVPDKQLQNTLATAQNISKVPVKLFSAEELPKLSPNPVGHPLASAPSSQTALSPPVLQVPPAAQAPPSEKAQESVLKAGPLMAQSSNPAPASAAVPSNFPPKVANSENQTEGPQIMARKFVPKKPTSGTGKSASIIGDKSKGLGK